jgi:EAL domain-containing protein (putative c-di-GMP-specific phosphodiesterase class I)
MSRSLRSLRLALLFPALSVMLIFAIVVGVFLSQRLYNQAHTDAMNEAQAQADKAYALLRGRFEYQLLSSQGQQSRYKTSQPIIQEETILLLKNLMSDWSGMLIIHDKNADWIWLWNGVSWQYKKQGQRLSDDGWLVEKNFLPWQWMIQVRPNVSLIEQQVARSRLLLLALIAGLWLISASLLWWRLHKLVLQPISAVTDFLMRLTPSQQEHIELDGSQDVRVLALQLNQLSERLYGQHAKLADNMRLLADEHAYMRALLDAQPAITILTNGIEMVDANDALFRFFPEYQNLADFKSSHACIRNWFIPYSDPLGYDYLEPHQEDWVRLASIHDYRVLMKKNGENHNFMVRARSYNYQGNVYYIIAFDDISHYVAAELAMREQLLQDTQTHLPNRIRLVQDMQAAPQGIVIIKLLGLARLNEVYGFQFTDAYILALVQRLKSEQHQIKGLIGPYRLSGSEFAFQLFDDDAEQTMWALRTKRLLSDLAEHDLEIWGAQIPVMISGGVSLWDDEVEDVEQLLLQATMAMNRARQQHVAVLAYDSSWRERQKYQQAQEWLEKIRDALVEDRIEPVFQPIFNPKTQQIEKYECLVRMREHSGALIAPGLFMDAIKHTREYLRLSKVMFERSCAYFAHRTERFTLNLAEDDFIHPEHLQALCQIIERYDVGSRVTIEVLESEEISSYEQMCQALMPLRNLGCQVAIDDFGSGYSNFAHIKGLSADVIKIDGSLIQLMHRDKSQEGVVIGLIEFGHQMGLNVIAEFVSTPALVARLSEMGVDGIQGYAISPPIRMEDMDKPLIPLL